LETTVEDISTTKKRLKIEIPSAVIREEYNSSLNNVKMKAKIPGFRPGKIPNNLIEKKFGDDIRADIIDRLVPQYYSKALKDADLVPVTMPTLEDTLEIKKDQPLAFSLTVEVRPKISDLTYTELKVEFLFRLMIMRLMKR
jgi:trigger factor